MPGCEIDVMDRFFETAVLGKPNFAVLHLNIQLILQFEIFQKQELYWCDVSGIHRITYKGENLVNLFFALPSKSHPYAAVVHENFLYWIDL